MDDPLESHVESLLAGAEAASALDDWASVRRLAGAALVLAPEHLTAAELLARSERHRPDEGERRQLTVMFCDLVGSTALSQHNDPEVLREVIRSYRHVVDVATTRSEGHIALWIGDGALVYFGHPRSHEDDAWRAVRAGLDLVAGLVPVADEARRRHGIDLDVRVAIHTGLVVRAEMGTPSAPDHDAIIGETPNVAARLQDKARPGTVVISQETHALVRGRFAVIPVGPFRLRGIAGEVSAYEVRAEAPRDESMDRLPDGGALVSRQEELDTLTRLWAEARAGGTGSVLVQGDPGIGKTRLVAELRSLVLERGGRALICGCSNFHRATPLRPLRRLIEAAAGIRADDDRGRRLRLVEEALAGFGRTDATPLVADLLGLLPDDRVGLPELDPQRLRESTLQLLVEWVAAESATAPLLIVIDDVQWADPTTLEVITQIIARRLPGLLLVLLARSDMPARWPVSAVAVLHLGPLDRLATAKLVAEVSAGKLDGPAADAVVERSDGVPLFVEELARAALLDSVGSRFGAVPPLLRDPLLARLTAAGSDLGLAQTIATIGDEVEHGLLLAVTGLDEAALQGRIAGLLDIGVLQRTESGAAYRFRHHLLADVAYGTQLVAVRQERHAAVARALSDSADGSGVDHGTRAFHLEHAGQPAAAIEEYLEAALRSQRQGATDEALQDLERGLELLAAVADADADARNALELQIRSARGFSWTARIGYGAPEVVADYQRCAELLRSVTPSPAHGRALVGVFTYFLLAGELDRADDVNQADRSRLAGDAVEPPLPESACWALTRFFRGDFAGCLAAAGEFLASPAGQLDAPVPERYPLPNEPVATILGIQCCAQALMGDIAGARRSAALAHERSVGLPFPTGPYSLAFSNAMAALAWFQTWEEERALATIGEIRDVVDRHGMTAYALLADLQRAGGDLRFGEQPAPEQFAMMVMIWELSGVRSFLPAFRASLAFGQIEAGDPTAALSTIASTEELVEATGAHFWDVPLRQYRGQARMAAGDPAGIEDIDAAAALAARQGTRLLELQARLAAHRADPGPGRLADLATIVATFEGAEPIPDLVVARAVLNP